MELVDVDRSRARSFGLADEAEAVLTPWHTHRKHQVLYAERGSMRLWMGEAVWMVPPGRAAWIPARTRHRVGAGALSLRTVYLDPRICQGLPAASAVFCVTALAREMILHAMRWGPRHRSSALSRAYFETLARLCPGWVEGALPLSLPVGRTVELQRAMTWTLEHLDERPTASRAAKAAGLSARTLARRFADETETTWRRFFHDARMVEATHRLSQPGARVGEVALGLGFESLSAFSRAYKAFCGVSPSQHMWPRVRNVGP